MFYHDNNGDIPVFSTIETWIKKLGLDTYKDKAKNLKDYAMIMDGSVVVGGQQMMVALGVNADASENNKAISYSDVNVLGMKLKPTWNSKETEIFLNEVIKQHGTPLYGLTDGGSNLKNAFSNSNIQRHCDIGHSMAAWLRRIYSEDADYKRFEKHFGDTRRLNLTNVAYLMPPKCRTKARWMNIFIPVKWAMKMLDNSFKWNKYERFHYGFIQSDATIIEELYSVSNIVDKILSMLKCNGLSRHSISQVKHLAQGLLCISNHTRDLYKCIIDYLESEMKLLSLEHPNHQISTDCIESLFGYVKMKTKANRNTGFTSLSLVMPLKTKMGNIALCRKFNVVDRLNRTTINDIQEWRKSDFYSTYAMQKRLFNNPELARIS